MKRRHALKSAPLRNSRIQSFRYLAFFRPHDSLFYDSPSSPPQSTSPEVPNIFAVHEFPFE